MEFDSNRIVWSVLQIGITLFETLLDVGDWLFSPTTALGGSAPIEFMLGTGLVVFLGIVVAKWIL